MNAREGISISLYVCHLRPILVIFFFIYLYFHTFYVLIITFSPYRHFHCFTFLRLIGRMFNERAVPSLFTANLPIISCLCLTLFHSASLCLSPSLFVFLSLSVSLSVPLSVSLSVCLFLPLTGSSRENVIDFTQPFMQIGTSAIFRESRKTISFFHFLAPFDVVT